MRELLSKYHLQRAQRKRGKESTTIPCRRSFPSDQALQRDCYLVCETDHIHARNRSARRDASSDTPRAASCWSMHAADCPTSPPGSQNSSPEPPATDLGLTTATGCHLPLTAGTTRIPLAISPARAEDSGLSRSQAPHPLTVSAAFRALPVTTLLQEAPVH